MRNPLHRSTTDHRQAVATPCGRALPIGGGTAVPLMPHRGAGAPPLSPGRANHTRPRPSVRGGAPAPLPSASQNRLQSNSAAESISADRQVKSDRPASCSYTSLITLNSQFSHDELCEQIRSDSMILSICSWSFTLFHHLQRIQPPVGQDIVSRPEVPPIIGNHIS